MLGFGSANTDLFWLGEERTGTRIQLDTETGSMRAASFTLSFAETGEPYHLVGVYRIAEAVQRDGEDVPVRVPVLPVAAPPHAGCPGLFRAELRLPPAWSVAEGFPTGLEADGEGLYVVDLPVVPSVISLRGRADGAWRPGLPLLIDVLIGAILLAFGFMGWRHVKRAAS